MTGDTDYHLFSNNTGQRIFSDYLKMFIIKVRVTHFYIRGHIF